MSRAKDFKRLVPLTSILSEASFARLAKKQECLDGMRKTLDELRSSLLELEDFRVDLPDATRTARRLWLDRKIKEQLQDMAAARVQYEMALKEAQIRFGQDHAIKKILAQKAR